MPLRIGIFGRGRLGSAIAAAARATDDLEVAWVVGRDDSQTSTTALAPVDVALEVSHADTVANRLDWARATGTDLIIGTTGWDPVLAPVSRNGQSPADNGQSPASNGQSDNGQSPASSEDERAIGILLAPNFSLTVALMQRISLALGGYAALQGADLAVSEVHHTRKVDAPSGTAILLRDTLAQGSGRASDAIQTTSLRLGEVVGRHDVHLASAAESITLTHEAHTRDVFAAGALTAIRWLPGRRGTFTFSDLADEVLNPLFQPTPTQKEEP